MKNITNNNNENENTALHNLNNDGYNNELIFSLVKNNLEKFQLNNPAKSIILKRIFSQLIFEPAFLKLMLDKNGGVAVRPENIPENANVCLNSESTNINILNITAKQNNIAADILDNYIYNYILNYINPSLKNLHNPFLMKDMDKAVNRITKALVNDEKICVFGDYDVDGITATSFLVLFLREINKYIVKVDNKDDNAGNNTQNIKTAIDINNNVNNNIDDNAQNINNEGSINHNNIDNGGTIIYKIPDRIKHGYGLGIEPINELINDNNVMSGGGKGKHVSLIITVDLGISNYEPVVYANSKNIDVIICDHHEIPEKIPPAAAILNPKQKDDKFPFKFLPGVGIAFNLAMALRKKLFDDGLINSYPNLKDFLDIVCIGIVGDIVPMYDENRLLVSYGLKKINSDPRPGIKELKKICNLRFDNVTESDIAWKIAPKINSSGRVGNPNIAIELLISQDYEEARTLALKLDELNKKRKKLETECFNRATIKINQINNTLGNFNPTVFNQMVILFDDSWHPGVIGIASSRLSEYLMKPVLLLSGFKEDIFIGSARSYGNIDIYSILKQFDNFFIKFGGHKLACGLSIKKSELNKFIEAVNKFGESDLNKFKSNNSDIKFDYDEELLISNINNELINKLKLMAPYGVLNEQPKFCIKNPLIDNIITRKVKNSYNSYNNIGSGNTKSEPANKVLNNNSNLKKIISNEYFTCDILNCSDKNKKSNKAIIFKNISCFRTEDFDFNNFNNKMVNSIIFEFFNNYIKILDIN